MGYFSTEKRTLLVRKRALRTSSSQKLCKNNLSVVRELVSSSVGHSRRTVSSFATAGSPPLQAPDRPQRLNSQLGKTKNEPRWSGSVRSPVFSSKTFAANVFRKLSATFYPNLDGCFEKSNSQVPNIHTISTQPPTWPDPRFCWFEDRKLPKLGPKLSGTQILFQKRWQTHVLETSNKARTRFSSAVLRKTT